MDLRPFHCQGTFFMVMKKKTTKTKVHTKQRVVVGSITCNKISKQLKAYILLPQIKILLPIWYGLYKKIYPFTGIQQVSSYTSSSLLSFKLLSLPYLTRGVLKGILDA